MNYQQTLDYLYAQLPMFTRMGDSAIKKDITNTVELCRRIGNPEKKFKSIHIAGTNGKGSTSHMLAAILQTAGYKTGLYTSPHLKDFRERIRINGEMIPKPDVVRFVQEQIKNMEEIDPSFFEVTVAMAFDHFERNKVDIAVIETGLGGRLDSTNVIMPILSVITNIGYDHMSILGNTLREIASEKAGIIKPGVPVVIGERQAEVEGIFVRKARECKSKLVFGSEEWRIETEDGRRKTRDRRLETEAVPLWRGQGEAQNSPQESATKLSIKLDLTGSYQLKNLATVLSSVEQLRALSLNITNKHIQDALKQVQKLTGLQGRWQTLSNTPLVICDTGHNLNGIQEVLKNIKITPHEKLHMVIGMLKDKDIHKILSILPGNAVYYFCSPDLPRAKPSGELLSEALAFSLSGKSYGSVKEAFEAAKNNAKAGDLIFVGGSTFVVAEII